jgi:hypothetical protein
MKSNTFIASIVFFCILIISSCENKKSTSGENPIVLKNDKPRSKKDTSLIENAPIINIADTIAMGFNIISIKDSAANGKRLSTKLDIIYKERLAEVIKKNKLTTTGAPVAWYKNLKAPFFFEAGIPVDKKPGKLPKGIIFKKISSNRIIVAHYFGPYTETTLAYQALKDWLKEEHKSQSGEAYEIYVGEALDKDGKPVDPYKVQTDIVIPYH